MDSKMIETIRKYFKTQPVEKAWVLGSFSRGEERLDSDVDILVSYLDSNSLSLLSICHIINKLGDLLGRKVDLVEEGHLLPFASASVEKDKLLIYERAA